MLARFALSIALVAQVQCFSEPHHTHFGDDMTPPHQLQARQEATSAVEAQDALEKVARQRETVEIASNQLFDLVVGLGAQLEGLTNLAANASEIRNHAKQATELLPQIAELRSNLLQMVTGPSVAELRQFKSNAESGAEQLAKAIKSIGEAADDANVLKKHFVELSETFKSITQANDHLFLALFPSLKEGGANAEGGNPENSANGAPQAPLGSPAGPDASQPPTNSQSAPQPAAQNQVPDVSSQPPTSGAEQQNTPQQPQASLAEAVAQSVEAGAPPANNPPGGAAAQAPAAPAPEAAAAAAPEAGAPPA